MKQFFSDNFTIARIAAAILLIVSRFPLPYGYYTFLRITVTAVSIWGIFIAAQSEKMFWLWVFIAIAILFNPLFPIYLTKFVWGFFDIGTAILLLVSIFTFRYVVKEGGKGEL